MVVKTKRSEVLAVQIEKKKEMIKEKKIFFEEKKSIRDLSLKTATFFSIYSEFKIDITYDVTKICKIHVPSIDNCRMSIQSKCLLHF